MLPFLKKYFGAAFCLCSLIGQGQESLAPYKYEQWGTLSRAKISPKGNWISFSIDYSSGLDTLYLASTKNARKIAFPKAQSATFVNDTLFGCLDYDGSLKLVGLKNHYSYCQRGVAKYVVADGFILLHMRTGELIILDLSTGQNFSAGNVDGFSLSPDKSKLVTSAIRDSTCIVTLMAIEKPNKPQQILKSSVMAYSDFIWHKDSKAFVFTGSLTSTSRTMNCDIHFYDVIKGRLYSIDKDFTNWPANHSLATYPELLVSDDASTVFMLYTRNNKEMPPPRPEIWNAQDKVLYAYKKANGTFSSYSKLYFWKPLSGEISPVGDQERTGALLLNKQLHALIYNPSDNRPALKYYADRDFYIKNLKTGKNDLLLSKFEGRQESLLCSPTGEDIAYYKDGNWWAYSTSSRRHSNLTGKLPAVFSDLEYDRPGSSPAYGCAGWSADGKFIFLYDQYDVWEVAVNGKDAHRITSGSENCLIYRIHNFDNPIGEGYNMGTRIINRRDALIFTATTPDNALSKLYMWNGGAMELLLGGNQKLTMLSKASETNSYIAATERYDAPPTLLHLKKGTSTAVFRSNIQHDTYKWGKSELVEYTNAAGQILKGVLFFPSDYKAEKNYPMVVHIYERQTHHLHSYTNPSLYNAAGFNKANFTNNGYFVFYPDIIYAENTPGISALECVTAAVETVLKKYPVASGRIGLIGHSFGGYETNYIISRSSLFSAAVSGNGISDLLSCYFSVGWSYGLPNTWRFESDQFRISRPPFDNAKAYLDNSPISFVKDVNTPLLSWIGEHDTQVNPIQTMELHIALRRLGKEHVMLVYPNEGHVLVDPVNQSDLTLKIMQWFDYYLKNDLKPEWIRPADE